VTRLDFTFAGVVGVQVAHSVEEYVGRLYLVFPPARAVSGLISQDLRRGLVIINVALALFGAWRFLWLLRWHGHSARLFGWPWVMSELVYGVGHPLRSLLQLRYTPGVATAPVLLVLALYLARQLRAPQVQAAA
jgi:hypothetical protein